MHGKRILVVDDDDETCSLVKLAFERCGATVIAARDGRQGLRKLYDHRPHLILLDVLMPRMSGWDVLRRIRELSSSIPVLLLTAKDYEQDMLHGFNLGADDYIVKPFKVKALEARVRSALLRRPVENDHNSQAHYDDGYLAVDIRKRIVRVDGRPVNLTPTEFDLLSCLLQRRGGLCTHQQILNEVWGGESAGSIEAVHTFIWQLRQKIEPRPGEPTYVVSMRGVGYLFEPLAAP